MSDVLFFMSEKQAETLAALAIAGESEDKAYQAAVFDAPSIDIALFGRMVASDPSLNYDAAAQVAHSISTHAVQTEFDYFTAVDDLSSEDTSGAGHLGTVEYNAATLYRYATVNVQELERTLGEQAADAVRRLCGSADLLHADRQAEYLRQPHAAGCGLCHRAARPAGQSVRRL